ncbi:MAG: hypothetical protein GXY44_11405 [Phycisphaerales bacterium]|nr:hypothetical protein [Phycisphaerales bacterium]
MNQANMLPRGWAYFAIRSALAVIPCLFHATYVRAEEGCRYPDNCNVIWSTPSQNSFGSMPLGNGDIGLNLWVEENGDLLFYISKTDAWSELHRLLKLGRIRVRFSPNPFIEGRPFRQELKPGRGEVEIHAGEGDSAVATKIWVDANQPVIQLETTSNTPFDLQVSLENWRTEPREIVGTEAHSFYGMQGSAGPVESADTILPPQDDRLMWYHRNTTSPWSEIMRDQFLEEAIALGNDPLLHRTFGGAVKGAGLTAVNSTTLASRQSSPTHTVSIYALTDQTDTAERWVSRLTRLIESVDALPLEKAYAAHLEWWSSYWNRSRLRVWASGEAAQAASIVSRGHTLQRFVNACGGRGAFPIKFNGSIFTVDAVVRDRQGNTESFNADYRLWGGPFWFQNMRLIYWPMLASGDLDLMMPLFNMYLDTLPLARIRNQRYFGHGGAYFPETMSFWGTYSPDNYGDHSQGQHPSYVKNRYIKYHYLAAIELLAMMLDYHAYTQDRTFLRDKLLPLAAEVIDFYDLRYPRDERQRLRLEPAQVLETYHEPAVNPLPDIAALKWVLDALLRLPEDPDRALPRERWTRFRSEIPPLPSTVDSDGSIHLLPAETYGKRSNSENPELYAVFPFRIYGVGKPDLDIALRTYHKRHKKAHRCWHQDDVQAAFLGLAGETAEQLVSRFSQTDPASRFPAFWAAGNDWIPNQCHGGNGMMALQTMLLQAEGTKILLFPAWPKHWNVEFKLNAPYNTTVECSYQDGEVQWLKVTPADRKRDVTVLAPS